MQHKTIKYIIHFVHIIRKKSFIEMFLLQTTHVHFKMFV